MFGRSEVLLVEALRGDDRVGCPVDHDIGEQLVQTPMPAESAIVKIPVGLVGPGGELLQNVRRQTHGRVLQSEA